MFPFTRFLLLFFMTLTGVLVHAPTAYAEGKQALPSAAPGKAGALARHLPDLKLKGNSTTAPRKPVLTPNHTKGVIQEITRDIQRARQSRLERAYNARLDSLERPLEQFGYNMLEPRQNTSRTGSAKDGPDMPPGAVQDDYILQPGDTVYVIVRGQRHHRKAHEIRSNGRLVIKHFEPVNAAGRSIAAVREELRRQAEKLTNTRIYLSLHDINGIGIDVIGHVKQPGQYRLTSFHTVIDALRKSGGVRKSGSLRRVKLVRRDGERHRIDLYGYLLDQNGNAGGSGQTATTQLRPGDRIIVPPVGPTVAAAGSFQRPGIYELAGHEQAFWLTGRNSKTTLAELAAYTGGAMPEASGKLIRMRLDSKGYERIHTAKSAMDDIALENGDILMLRKREPKRTEHVRLAGHVSSPGIYGLSEAGSLSRLIKQHNVFKNKTYPLFAVVKRYNPETMAIKHKIFSPMAVKKGRNDIDLQSGDHVIFLSYPDIRQYFQDNGRDAGKPVKTGNRGGTAHQSRDDTRADGGQGGGTARHRKTGARPGMRPGIRLVSRKAGNTGPGLLERPDYITPALRKIMRRATLSVSGNVLHPGRYPVAGSVPARRIIDAAGGIAGQRANSRIEITSRPAGASAGDPGALRQRKYYDIEDTNLRSARLEAGDSLRVNSADDDYGIGQARITGAVKHPGKYDILPGDTLLTLIKRAGGLSEQAYPAGAILSRESARERQRQRFRSKARELEMRLARLLSQDSEKGESTPERIKTIRNIINELRTADAVGRITVEADPQILENNREQDVLLEDGDHLHMPKRPSTVRVAGEVLSPAALQFETGKTAKNYINGAGGFTAKADKDRVFIVFPDGHAKPIATGVWNHAPLKIPPGSTIVVPRDMEEFKFMDNARDITQILSNVATTALFADDIGD